MQHRARSFAALAGALSLAVATVTVGAASAAALPRAAAGALARARTTSTLRASLERRGRATTAAASVRTVTDGAYRMTRTIERIGGADRVVFTATDLRTGGTYALNARRSPRIRAPPLAARHRRAGPLR